MKTSDLYIAILALTLAACGGSSDPEPEGEPDPGGPTPAAKHLPKVFGTCPEFPVYPEFPSVEDYDTKFETERGDRWAYIYMTEEAKRLDGPLVIFWSGLGGSAGLNGLSFEAIDELVKMGGIFVAPWVDPKDEAVTQGFWTDWDLLLADQVVACAIQKVGIDKRRIHSIGFSAGGFQTYRMLHERSGYLASAIMFSPGSNPPEIGPRQEPTNKVPSMISWGEGDPEIHKTLAKQYFDTLTSYGFFSMICHHPGGHLQPPELKARALDFFLAHPFGTDPSPYADGIPDDYPSYCSLTQ